MRRSVLLVLCAILLLAAAVQARDVASRSERRAAERARAAEADKPKSTPPPPPPPAPPKPATKKADDDDDDDDDKPHTPVDPEDDEDDRDEDDAFSGSAQQQQQQQQQPPQPSAPVDPDARENWADLDVMTSLWRAVSSGDMPAVRSLVEANRVVPRLRSADGRSGLFWAYEFEQSDIAEYLKANGAREDVRDRDGRLPREMAPPAGSGSSRGSARSKPSDFVSCDPCVAAGFGWDTIKNECSATASNRICPDDDDDDDDDDN